MTRLPRTFVNHLWEDAVNNLHLGRGSKPIIEGCTQAGLCRMLDDLSVVVLSTSISNPNRVLLPTTGKIALFQTVSHHWFGSVFNPRMDSAEGE